jgi:polyhydroxybutyrate depolymerase
LPGSSTRSLRGPRAPRAFRSHLRSVLWLSLASSGAACAAGPKANVPSDASVLTLDAARAVDATADLALSAGNGGDAPPSDLGAPAVEPDSGSMGVEAGPAPAPGASASPGCTGAAGPGDGYHDLQVGTVTRKFIIHLPSTYDGRRPFPVIFAFHSKGDDATQWDSNSFKLKDAAGEANVLVYMQSLVTAAGNIFDAATDLAYTDAVVAWATTNVCFDTHRRFLLGHSNGADFARLLGCQRGDVFSAEAVHAGYPGETAPCKGPIHVWDAIGLLDNPNQVAAAKATRDFWLQANHCNPDAAVATKVDPVSFCTSYAGCASGSSVVYCEDPQNDHKWAPTWMSQGVARFFSRR